jgi:hypothetical protein
MINELLINESPKCNCVIILQRNCSLFEGPLIAIDISGRITFCVEKDLESKLMNISHLEFFQRL